MSNWEKIKEVVRIQSKWLEVICEQWIDSSGNELDYWRVEKSNSIIIIPSFKDQLILPAKQFRPGVNCKTLDFPGGRVTNDDEITSAYKILYRELNIIKKNVIKLTKLNNKQIIINSSFSNQKLHIYHANIDCKPSIDHSCYATSEHRKLNKELHCLQCLYALNVYLEMEINNES